MANPLQKAKNCFPVYISIDLLSTQIESMKANAQLKKRVFCLTYVSAGHSSLKLCKVSVKSIKNISPALCSTAGFHKPWSPEVFPVLEPEVQLAKQIPESLALLCGHEVS